MPVYVAAESYKFARCARSPSQRVFASGGWPAQGGRGGDGRQGTLKSMLWRRRKASAPMAAPPATFSQDSPAAPPTHRRLYPLNQRDLPVERKQLDFGPLLPASVAIDNPSRDYTPPQVGVLCVWLGVQGPCQG